MDDRFTRGLAAGFIGWMPTVIFNLISFHLNFSKLRFLDFAAVFIYGHKPHGTLETMFASLAVMAFMSVLGIFFAFLIKDIGSAHLWLKGWIYGNTIWFSIYAITLLFKVTEIETISLPSAFSNFLASSIWGVTMAYALIWLDKKVKQGG